MINTMAYYESTSVIPAKPPLDLLNGDGNELSNSGASLDKIFSLAESGKSIKDAIQEVEDGKSQQKEEKEEQEVVPDKPEDKQQDKLEDKPADDPVKADLDKQLSDDQKKKDDEANPRDKLLKQADDLAKKDEAKPDDKKKDDVEAVPEDELKVLPHDKPKTAARIKALWNKAHLLEQEVTTTKNEAKEKAEKLAKLEEQLSKVQSVNPEVDAQIKAKLDELAMFRRRYELDKDPEVKTKFDSRQESSEKTITEVLSRRNAGDALLGLIKEEGGWSKFSESQRLVTINNAEGGQEQVTSAQLADNILKALPLGERKRIEAAMMDQLSTASEKARYFEEETKKASEFFKNREEAQQKSEAAQRQAFADAQKTIEEFQKTAIERNDWLKEKDIAPTLSPEEKAAIQEDNNYTKQLQSLFKKNLEVKDIPSMLGVVMDSVAFYNERRTSAKLLAENKRLQSELKTQKESFDKFRSATKTTTRPGSLSGGGSSSAPANNKTKPAASLDEALSRIEQGQRPDSDE